MEIRNEKVAKDEGERFAMVAGSKRLDKIGLPTKAESVQHLKDLTQTYAEWLKGRDLRDPEFKFERNVMASSRDKDNVSTETDAGVSNVSSTVYMSLCMILNPAFQHQDEMRDSIVVDAPGGGTDQAVALDTCGRGLSQDRSGPDVVDADAPTRFDGDTGGKVLSCDRSGRDVVDVDSPPTVDLSDTGRKVLSCERWAYDMVDEDGPDETRFIEEEDDIDDEENNTINRFTSIKNRRMPSPTSSIVSPTSSFVKVTSPPRKKSTKRQRANTSSSAASREGRASTVTSPIPSESYNHI